MVAIYPTLIGEIARRGIKKTVIADRLNISDRTLYNKLSGLASFTWEEACQIQQCFFPDMDITALFAKTEQIENELQVS